MSSELLQTAQKAQLLATGVAALACAGWWPEGALSVLAGGLVMAGNFWFLRTLAQRVFVGPANSAKVVYALLLGSKLLAVLGVITFLVASVKLNPVGLAVGMATFFFGVAGALIRHRRAVTPTPS